MRRAQDHADKLLTQSGVRLPPKYRAVSAVMKMLSPATLNDDAAVANWLEVFEMAGGGEAVAAGQSWIDTHADRRHDLTRVTTPCRVVAFTDDLITPPYMGAEVARAIPNGDYVEIPACGHLGHLERPEAVNEAILTFFDKY
jgi:pimeloyl-ACP methyl ester carboxylesterase